MQNPTPPVQHVAVTEQENVQPSPQRGQEDGIPASTQPGQDIHDGIDLRPLSRMTVVDMQQAVTMARKLPGARTMSEAELTEIAQIHRTKQALAFILSWTVSHGLVIVVGGDALNNGRYVSKRARFRFKTKEAMLWTEVADPEYEVPPLNTPVDIPLSTT